MSAANPTKSNSYDRLIEHWQIEVADKVDGPSTIIGADAKSVAGLIMSRKPVFSTAC